MSVVKTIEVSIYEPATGKIVAHAEAPTIDSFDVYLSQGFAIYEGYVDEVTHFINPETGNPNLHQNDSTKVLVIDERKWTTIRARRNELADSNRWTVMPDSPLTEENKAAWLLYLQTLQRVTIDYSDPDEIVWPTPPELQYINQ